MKVLVIAPHPDDEVLGVGATMHRLSEEGHDITVAIVTKGWSPLFPEDQVERVRREAKAANAVLGVNNVRFLDLPVTRLHALPKHELNAAFDALVDDERPEQVFIPFPGDRHEDHRQVFEAALVAMRPVADHRRENHRRVAGATVPVPQRVLCYETLSETHWSVAHLEPVFQPQVWYDVTGHLDAKLEAMRAYASQVRPEPDARSLEAASALAKWRGSVVGFGAAEAFTLVRQCHSVTAGQ